MTGIQALRGLPKDLRATVIACIIKSPFDRSRNLHNYLSSDISVAAAYHSGSQYKNMPSVLFALGFSWNEVGNRINWSNKFVELEGVLW